MSFPPPGYDDEIVVPQKRLQALLGQFEGELNKIQSVFQQHVPGKFLVPKETENAFWSLRASAEALGPEYHFLIEKLIQDYEHFRDAPDQENLDRIYSDLKNLQLLLVG